MQKLGVISKIHSVILPDGDEQLQEDELELPEAFLPEDNELNVLRIKGYAVVDMTRFRKEKQEHNWQYCRQKHV